MNAAAQFEAQLAAVLDQEPTLRSNLVAQFEADGFPSLTATTNNAIDFQTEVVTNGLPVVLQDGLTALGIDLETITNIEINLLTADPGSMAGQFPQSLTNAGLDSSTHALAAALRDASLRLLNPSFLPSGQFRFDLPTEPGHTYTIQFSQSVADPAGWTTISTNQTTTALLSFTNTPVTSAGFYRVSSD
jgi:hypothetical protein